MADWVFDSLVGCLQSPMWRYPVDSFLDHHCVVFDPGEENKFSYTEVYKEYQTMVENLLESFMSDLGITPEMFTEACSQTGKMAEEHEKLFEQILAADDFLVFKHLMVQRNIDLELQALALLQKQLGHSPEAYQAGGGVPPKEGHRDDDDSVLQEVLRQSKQEFDLQNSLDEDELERLIEIAKEESLRFSQGEQQKVAEDMTEELKRVALLSDGGTSTSGVEKSSLVAQQQQTSILALKDEKSVGSKLEEQHASSVLASATTEVNSPPSLPTAEVHSPPPLPTAEVHSLPPLPTTEVHSVPSLPTGATSPTKPEQRQNKRQSSRDKPPPPQARKQEPLRPVHPSAGTSSTGSRSQLRELSGSEAAAKWLESAKSELQQPTSSSSAVHMSSGPSPEDLREREAHLRQQRDHLLEMKRKTRAQEFNAYTASQSSSASKSTQVAKSAARGELGLGLGGGEGGQKRGHNTGVLCTAIAGRLKKELAAQENHS